MAPRRDYTHALTAAQVESLRTWFGTPKHAYHVLKMERDVPFAMLQRVWAGYPVQLVHRNAIRRRLNWWATHTLRTVDPSQFPINLAAMDAAPYSPEEDE